MAIAPYQLGFSAVHHEAEFNALPIHGHIPSWLRGSLIRTGPGTLEVGKQSYRHWFDGLAMLHKFSFEDGTVRGEFGTTARHSFLERLVDPLPRLTDNATANITMQGELIELTASITSDAIPILTNMLMEWVCSIVE